MKPFVSSLIGILLVLSTCIFLGKLVTAFPGWIPILFPLVAFSAILAVIRPVTGVWLLIFFMLLSPEIPLLNPVAAKSVVLRLDDFYMVGLVLSWLVFSAIQKGGIAKVPLGTHILAYLGIHYLSSGLGILRGDIRFVQSLFFLLKYTQYFILYYMVYHLTDSEKVLKSFLTAGLLCCLFVTAFAYFQMREPGRVSAPFEAAWGDPVGSSEANTLAGYYLVVFGVLLGFWTQNPGSVSWVVLGLVFLILPPFFRTLSRSGYLGFMALFISLISFSRRKVFQTLLGMSAGLLVLSLFLPSVMKEVVNRIGYTFAPYYSTYYSPDIELREVLGGVDVGQPLESSVEPSARARIQGYKIIWEELLPKHPILGHGTPIARGGEGDFVRFPAEVGLLGLGVWLWLVGSVFSRAWRYYREFQEPLARGLSLGLMGAIVGLLTTSLFMNTFIIVRIMEPFWCLAALVMALPKVYHRQDLAL
ncbi:MAG: O-antigen ligase family protein [Elusimicrobia bacterium]|nr:O-antigen ligase family protein [Elusimicrobiota bacterium]